MITWEKVINKQPVGSNGSVDSDAIRVSFASREIGIKVKIESGTAPEVQVLYQVIDSGQGDKGLVGGAEDLKNDIDWVTPETGAVLIESIKSGTKMDGHTIMPSDWIRIRAKGINSNSANTVASVWIAIDDNGTC